MGMVSTAGTSTRDDTVFVTVGLTGLLFNLTFAKKGFELVHSSSHDPALKLVRTSSHVITLLHSVQLAI